MRRFALLTKSLLSSSLLLAASALGQANAVVIPNTLIQEKVINHVQERLATMVSKADRKNVTVSVMHLPITPLELPAAAKISDVQFTLDSRLGEVYSERGLVQVSLKDAAGNHRDFGVPIQIIVKKPVWVVQSVINAHESMSRANLSLELKDVSQCYAYTMGEDQDLNPYVARVNMRPGEILDTRKISIPPDVVYNNEVRIFISTDSGLTVSVPGVALSDGKIGETIRVRQSVFQRKDYNAKIIDKNQVLVEI